MPKLNERGRRMVVAAEAKSLGRGSIALVAKASGISYPTIRRGLKELKSRKEVMDSARIRRPGGGRKKIQEREPRLVADLESLVRVLQYELQLAGYNTGLPKP